MKSLVAFGLALALIGCGGLSSGEIIATDYRPAHDENYQAWEFAYFTEDCSYNSSTKSESCYPRPVYHWVTRCCQHIPDKWFVQIKGNCKPENQGVLECETAWREVTQDYYNGVKTGQIKWFGPTPTPFTYLNGQ